MAFLKSSTIFKYAKNSILFSAFIIGGIILLGYDFFPSNLEYFFWLLNSWVIFLVMLIRPLSDMLPKVKILKKLVPFRKEMGILTSMIVVCFGLAKYFSWEWERFVSDFFSYEHWGIYSNEIEPIFWGRIGFVVGVILLLTSNKISVRLLGAKKWKHIQRLSYVYFFAGAYYVWEVFGKTEELYFMSIILVLTVLAFLKKKLRL